MKDGLQEVMTLQQSYFPPSTLISFYGVEQCEGERVTAFFVQTPM